MRFGTPDRRGVTTGGAQPAHCAPELVAGLIFLACAPLSGAFDVAPSARADD